MGVDVRKQKDFSGSKEIDFIGGSPEGIKHVDWPNWPPEKTPAPGALMIDSALGPVPLPDIWCNWTLIQCSDWPRAGYIEIIEITLSTRAPLQLPRPRQ